ncbi:MAG: hypothetical protein KJN95_01850 [Gammaproteobacteria bacterium]|nr:hypothetical protein [Gammaproteobacteria bacterium]MBT8436453.1 hypothetical protein [Gammaproteobacteria bacterium]
MKPLKLIKYLLLLIPFNTLAHPGHDDIVTQSGLNDFASIVTGVVIALAVAAAMVVLLRGRKQRITRK